MGSATGSGTDFLPQLEFLYSRLSLLSKLWAEPCVRLPGPPCRHRMHFFWSKVMQCI
jgi:hypothetical protein